MIVVSGLTIRGLFGPVVYIVIAVTKSEDELTHVFKHHKNQQYEEV
jgi:hypothetical protein